ncbi:hypothetical protein QBC47DRAFT_463536 [Echria macrotheca]|uniref:Uncharacterized protein n=1 Tax=Echria macrotheca TaxID=438768 RepID=A0AAJ0B6N9_9PEZI|nr:hypothetical protein QBC47DRAFT_463536 [Echria macrotheca]
MGEMRSRLRAVVADGLLNVAILLTLIPLLTNILFLIAGTFQVNDASRPGSRVIGLSSLSIASFNGVVPSPNGHGYEIQFQLFHNAFTYSYPSAPLANTTSGILRAGPSSSMEPLALVELMPSILSLPANETRCLDTSNAQDDCSPFWKAVLANRQTPFRLPGYFVWSLAAMQTLSVLVMLLALTAEACIRWRPWWMRCQCWWGWYRRMCPLPKRTTQAEIEELDGHVWDGVRLWSYGLVVAYALIPVAHASLLGLIFCSAMGALDYDLPKRVSVDAMTGRGFLMTGWGSVTVAVFAFLLVFVRWLLTRKNGWMEQQMPLLAGDDVIDETAV